MKHSHSQLATVLFLLLLITTVTAQSALGQDQSKKPPAWQQLRVVKFNGDMRALLGSLAESYGVVIGFETDSHSPPVIMVEAYDVTFHQLLDAIVRAKPEYRWREVDGSIEFFPASGGSAVLDTLINNFEVKEGHWGDTTETLLKLPEVQGTLAAMALTRNEEGYQRRASGGAFSLKLERVTVRRVLHEIARKSGTKFWVFRQFGDRQRFFQLRTSL